MNGRIISGIGILSLALFGATLGGCNDQKAKDDMTRLQQDNEALAAEKTQLAAAVAAKDQEIASLRMQQTPQPGPRGTDGWNNPGPSKPTPAPRTETRVEVAGDKLFASGSTTIMAAGKAELDKIANRIKSEYPNANLRVEGYTDTDPIVKLKNKFPTNEALSLARAKEVEKYLAARGIPSNRIESVGMGAANPRATKAASRRVEIVIMY